MKNNSGDFERFAERVKGKFTEIKNTAEKTVKSVTDKVVSMAKTSWNSLMAFVEAENGAYIEEMKKRAEQIKKNEEQERAHEIARLDAKRSVIERIEAMNKKHYESLESLRNNYFSMGEDDWKSYTDAIYEFCVSSIENIEKEEKSAILGVLRDVTGEIENSYEVLMNKQEKMENKLKGYGGLYRDKGGEGLYKDISLDNIERSIEVLHTYNNNLSNLKARLYDFFPTEGVSEDVKQKNQEYVKEFFAEVADMSVEEASMFTAYLGTLSNESFGKYIGSWAEKLDLSETIAKKLYSDENAELFEESAKSMSDALTDSLKKHFGSVPSSFFEQGVLAAGGFGDGFNYAIDKVLSDVNLKLENAFENMEGMIYPAPVSSVVNNKTSYNIYNSEPKSTALEIYKTDTMKRMLVGD